MRISGDDSGIGGSTLLPTGPAVQPESITPAVPSSNFSFQQQDWKNLLLPIFERYATSGLTVWAYQQNFALPDMAIAALRDWVTAQVGTSSSDTLPTTQSADNPQGCMYSPSANGEGIGSFQTSSLTNYSQNAQYVPFNPQLFLKNQGSNLDSTGTGWGLTQDLAVTEQMIQSGFCNTASQYTSVAIEHFAARLATVAQGYASILAYDNEAMGEIGTNQAIVGSNEPQILQNFVNQATTLFQQARYARLMYGFPTNLQEQLNKNTPTFTVINNLTDLARTSQNSDSVYVGSQLGTAALNPIYTFCGVVLIFNEPGDQVVQQSGGQSWGSVGRPYGSPYTGVYFIPATSVIPNPQASPAYNSYDPVDQNSNITNSNSITTRKVTFTTLTSGFSGVTIAGPGLDILVSSDPVNTGDPVGIYLQGTDKYGQIVTFNQQFNQTDMNNFFAYPHQWAVVMKIINRTPVVMGLVKLNPYDFPLNFSVSEMNSVLGLGATGGASVEATGIGSESLSSSQFSQQDIWDGIANLYSAAFPPKIFTDSQVKTSLKNGSKQYSFAYLFLQGLFNGYLMSNTYSPLIPTPGPSTLIEYAEAVYNPAVGWVFNDATVGGYYFDQLYPTPLVSDWLGKSSCLDWFYLRVLLATRYIVQSIYCPYDALVMPVSTILNSEQNGFATLSSSDASLTCLLDYMFAHPNQTVNASWPTYSPGSNIPLFDSNATIRTLYGQNYVSGVSTPSASYQWILPVSKP